MDDGTPKKKDPTLMAIERLQRERDLRRKSAEQAKRDKALENDRNEKEGRPGDVDFQRMINGFRDSAGAPRPHAPPADSKISICVRKRPISSKEVARRDFDSVTAINPRLVVHACKLKVDGITKFLENQTFQFDHTFGEADSTDSVYVNTVQPLVKFIFQKGRGTCFAYGQTGSGKTYTMTGIQTLAAREMYEIAAAEGFIGKGFKLFVSFYELYGGRCSDLLHDRSVVTIREDGAGHVVTQGLTEVPAPSMAAMLALVERGGRARTTHATAANETSSRSHAVCEFVLRDSSDRFYGKLSLVDLAGSERAADARHHNRQRRMESAEINKSLLALKECIRAIDVQGKHVPFRASKLTLLLKDSFTSKLSKVVMIAAVSPAMSASDHTINTLRYADRVKEKAVEGEDCEDLSDVSEEEEEEGGMMSPIGGAPSGPPVAAAAAGRPSGDKKPDRSSVPSSGPPRYSPLTVQESPSVPAAGGRAGKGDGIGIAAAAPRGGRASGVSARDSSPPPGTDDIVRAVAPSSGVGPSGGVRRSQSERAVGPAPPRKSAGGARVEDVKLRDVSDDEPTSDAEEYDRDFKGKVLASPRPGGGRGEDRSYVAQVRQAEAQSSKLKAAGGRKSGPSSAAAAPAAAGRAGGKAHAPKAPVDLAPSPAKDLKYLHRTLRREAKEDAKISGELPPDRSSEMLALQEAVSLIVEEEEALLSEHMSALQESAELLSEEGRLLAQVQGNDVIDYDIDAYATRLDQILRRKLDLTSKLLGRLTLFREHLALEEQVSQL